MSHEYREQWLRAHDAAGPTPAEKLEAVLLTDFEPPVSNRNRIAVWFAFYGEAKSRPTYMDVCRAIDQITFDALTQLCSELIEEGGYAGRDPALITQGLSALSEGLWLDLLVSPHTNDLDKSKRTVRAFLAATFPKHFPIPGRHANQPESWSAEPT